MKLLFRCILALTCWAGLTFRAAAFEITVQIDILGDGISTTAGRPLSDAAGLIRLGYFKTLTDEQIIANATNRSALEADFTEVARTPRFESTSQLQGFASESFVLANDGMNIPPGPPGPQQRAYIENVAGKPVYVWIFDQNTEAASTEYGIFRSNVVFNGGTTDIPPFSNHQTFQSTDTGTPGLRALVGTLSTGPDLGGGVPSHQLALAQVLVPGQIRLGAAAYTVSEGGSSVSVTVQRVGGTDGAVSATFSTAENVPASAQAGQDYTAVSQTVTFADGSAADQVVTIPILDDTTFEGDETFQVMLSNPAGGATLAEPSAATITIQENDAAPPAGTVRFTSASFSGAEDGGSITISATRASGAQGAITVQYSTSNGSAIAGTDYAATSGTLSWNDQESGVKSFTVPVIDNTADQPNKNFTVTLSNPTGGSSIVAPSTATVTIQDDDTAGTISFASATGTAAENSGSLSVTVQRTGGTDGEVSVSFSTANSSPASAQAGADYSATNQTVTFPNGSGGSQVVAVPILDDAAFEGNETFQATLTNPTGGATLGQPAAMTLTIVDDEIAQPGSFSFSSGTYAGAEAGGPVTITVTRNNGSDGQASVNYSVTSGTATAGSDFVATQGTLDFASGQTSATFEVTLVNDTAIEPDETVNLALSAPTNGTTLGSTPDAVLTITSEDQPPPVDQPDNLVAVRGKVFVGNDVYNNTGDGQIASRSGKGNWTASFVVQVQNDGNAPDSFRVTAVASGTAQNATVRYFRNGTDITPQIASSTGFIISQLPSRGTVEINVEVSFAGSERFTGYGTTVTTTSQRTASKSDVVRALGIVSEGSAPTTSNAFGNISTRVKAATGQNVLIGGFIIHGNQSKKVVARGIGFSLTEAGLPGALPDPTLELYDSAGRMFAFNNDWAESPNKQEIINNGLAPKNEKESAILATLAPGSYTGIVRGKDETTGVALVELYDLDRAVDSQLANISTRGRVETGDEIMIGGFIIKETGGEGARVLVRATGPSLASAGITDPLQDPTLELRNSAGELIASNNDWREAQESEIQASGIPPNNDREAAVITSLPAGNYTALVRGRDGATGVALVEVYNIQ